MVEIENRKKLLAQAQQSGQSKASEMSVYRFDFDKEYAPEGITDETITEKNRTVYRSIVKFQDIQATYLKVVYSWGGIYYFKNSTSITETIYSLDLKNFRSKLK